MANLSNINNKFLVTTGGNVGIGTTSPTTKLHVVGANNTTAFKVDFPSADFDFSANSTSGYTTSFHMNDTGTYIGSNSAGRALIFQTNDTDRLYINGNTGNVGIGNTVANGFGSDTVLAVYNATTPRIKLQNSTTGTANTDGGELNMSGSDFIIENREAGNIKIFNNGGERMRIQATTGNVGIGVTDPEKKLEVKSDTTYDGILIDTLSAPEINFRDRGNSDTLVGTGRHALDGFHIDTYSGNAFFIKGSNRYVGIGTTSPSQKLHVSGNARVTGAYYDSNNSPGTSGQVLSSIATGTDWIDQGDIIVGEADKAKSVVLRVKNSTAYQMTKGQVICEAVSASPPSGNLIEVALADNNGTNTMPALGILNEDLDAAGGANDEGDAIMFGKVSGIDTSAFDVGDEVFVSDTPGGLTITKPTGVKYIQKVGVVIRDDNTNGTIEVFGAGRVNDVPTPLYVDHANQRLGIGATSPVTKLDVYGTSDTYLTVRNNGGGYKAGIRMYGGSAGISHIWHDDTETDPPGIRFGTSANTATTPTTQLYIKGSNGNVGIGTTSPDAKLNITAGDNGAALLLEAQSAQNAWKNITFKTYVSESQAANFSAGSHIYTTSPGGATTWPFTEYGALVIEGRDNGNSGIALRTGNGSGQITRIAIRESGNVGIGTTSPARKFVVSRDNASSIIGSFQSENNQGVITFVGSATTSDIQVRIGAEANDLLMYAGNNERMRVDSSGNVGIGTTSPISLLEISQQLSAASTIDYPYTISSRDDETVKQLFIFLLCVKNSCSKEIQLSYILVKQNRVAHLSKNAYK